MNCRRVRDDLAAYADQALGAEERERVATHLVGCRACRDELAGIIQVRGVLAEQQRPCCAQPDLARRLVEIAGPEADGQLWMKGGASCALPSPRRRRRNRIALGLTGGTAAVLGTLGSLVLAAPPLATVSDPDGSSTVALPGPAAATAAALSVTGSGSGCPSGFDCPDELVGLALTELVVSDAGHVEAVYGRGTQQLAVVMQRGTLSGTAETSLNPVTWQSGDVVYCVMSANPLLARAAAQELPHTKASSGSTTQRLAAGWHQLAGSRR